MAETMLTLDEFIPYRLSFTSNLVSDTIAATYDALFGLKIPEWRVIAVAAEHDGITQQQIGALTRMDKVTVSRAAIALSQRGLIERAAHPGDGRARLLVLSAEGRRLYAAVAPRAKELERRMLAGFAAEDIERFVSMLRGIDARALALRAELGVGGDYIGALSEAAAL